MEQIPTSVLHKCVFHLVEAIDEFGLLPGTLPIVRVKLTLFFYECHSIMTAYCQLLNTLSSWYNGNSLAQQGTDSSPSIVGLVLMRCIRNFNLHWATRKNVPDIL
jgi:hypothetical protein